MEGYRSSSKWRKVPLFPERPRKTSVFHIVIHRLKAVVHNRGKETGELLKFVLRQDLNVI